MLDGVEIPVTFPEIGQVRGPTVARAQRTVTELGSGAVSVEEPLQRVLAPLPSLVKREFLGMPSVANGLQLLGDLVESVIPADPFPLSFAPGPDPFQRIEQPLGMVEVIERGLSPCTQVTSAVWILRISLDLDQPAVLHVADDPADGTAQLAHPRDLLDIPVLVAVRPVPLGLRTGKLTDTGHCSERPQPVGRALDPVPLLQVDPLR